MAEGFYNNAVYWVEVNRIQPNPFQPRKEFDESSLRELADSIRQYGVLQPLTVTRREITRADGGISVEYELVAGERRLRAAKLIGVQQVPVLIRSSEDSDKVKLEIAIIENLQREDLNPVDRAIAFKRLVDDFNLKHADVAKKVGKSREFVSNTLRLLALPEDMQRAIIANKITEGHSRPLLMLSSRPDKQRELFLEMVERKLAVRESERIARNIAVEKARKQDLPPDLMRIERALTDELGTRVTIEKKKETKGGRVRIDFYSEVELERFLSLVKIAHEKEVESIHNNIEVQKVEPVILTKKILPPIIPKGDSPLNTFLVEMPSKENTEVPSQIAKSTQIQTQTVVTNGKSKVDIQELKEEDTRDNLYSIQNFSI